MTSTNLGTGVESPPAPTRRRKTAILVLACAAMAMAGIDTAIVNIALPSVQNDFGVGREVVQWVVVAYGLLLGGFLIVGGRLTDRLGRRSTFTVGLAILAVMSLTAGLAQHPVVLITARGGQGLGAALLIPAALSLLAVTFPEGAERDRAIGTFGAVGGIAGSLGVVVGGLLTAGPGWRWAFFVNVPVGILIIAAAAVILAPDQRSDRTARLDLPAAVTVTAGLLLGVYALHHATGHGWLTWSTLALAVGAVSMLALFAVLESRSTSPLVPRTMRRNPTVVTANVAALLAFAALLGFIFLGTLLMQQVLGYSPIRTGAAWLATTLTVFVAAMLGGRLAAVLGVRRLLVSGLVLVAVGAFLLTRVTERTNYVTGLAPAFFLAGIGFGLCGPATQLAALSGVTDADAGIAAGLVETMREIGGATGVAVVTTALVAGTGLAAFHTAFAVVSMLAVAGVVVSAVGLRPRAGSRPATSRAPA